MKKFWLPSFWSFFLFFFLHLADASYKYAGDPSFFLHPNPSDVGIVTQTAQVTGESGPGISEFVEDGYNTTAYYAWVDNPVDHFHVYYSSLSNKSCGGYVYTSKVAKRENCQHATNGGPFLLGQGPFAPTCLGDLISDDYTVQLQNSSFVSFGMVSKTFVMGVMNPVLIPDYHFSQLLTGFGWLVVEGVNQVVSPGGEIAPRTAIGTDKDGRLILFEADGVEDQDKGLTLQQLSDWLLSLGVFNAVNLDGGGSSVTVINGTVVDHPTCSDTAVKCEREVATLTCIR